MGEVRAMVMMVIYIPTIKILIISPKRRIYLIPYICEFITNEYIFCIKF